MIKKKYEEHAGAVSPPLRSSPISHLTPPPAVMDSKEKAKEKEVCNQKDVIDGIFCGKISNTSQLLIFGDGILALLDTRAKSRSLQVNTGYKELRNTGYTDILV